MGMPESAAVVTFFSTKDISDIRILQPVVRDGRCAHSSVV